MAEVENESMVNRKIQRLFLCEADKVFLRPNELYFFVVDESCDECVELREKSNFDDMKEDAEDFSVSDLEHKHREW